MPDTPHLPTIDEMIELSEPGDAQISPDGSRVAYVVRTPDWQQNEYLNQMWLVEADADPPKPRQLTFAKQSSRSPRWSPDGEWIAFLSKREGDKHTQVYRLSASGGEAERLTEVDSDVQAIAWSPDGNAIAFRAPDPDSEEKKRREETYGEYRVEDSDYVYAHLWLLPLAGRQVRKLTSGDTFHVHGFDWAPHAGAIAFHATPTPDERDGDRGRIYTLDLATLAVRALTGEDCRSPRWSPDGSHIAFVRRSQPTYYTHGRIGVIASDGGEAHDVLMTFDEDPVLIDWGTDGLIFGALQRTEAHLFRVDPDGGNVTRLTPETPDGWFTLSATCSQNFERLALVAESAAQVADVWLLNPADGRRRQLTNFNTRVADWSLSRPEVFRWTSQDGTPIEGVLTRPVDFDPAQKYPLLVVIHGGPAWASFRELISVNDRRYYPIQLWSAKGAFVLQPNYRGSGGYGQAFQALNVRNLGVGDYADVISGVDALIAEGWVDPERVGAMGWSQGGYISAFIATGSDRFKAVSVGAGISNWITYYVNTDIHPFTRQYLLATPWDDVDIYQRTSPMTYLRQAKTPTLIQHGERDARVPLPNAYELYQGLQDMGVEVKLVVYAGMPHGVTKPRLARQILQENFDWFNRWLWGESPEAKAPAAWYVALESTDQRDDTGDLPALERFTGAQVQAVSHWARRDGTEFRILSGAAGLLHANDPIAKHDATLVPDTLPALTAHLAQQLTGGRVTKVVVYTGEAKAHPTVLIYVGCLQIAAGIAGGVSVEHRQVSDAGW